jgi:hypothetical protein
LVKNDPRDIDKKDWGVHVQAFFTASQFHPGRGLLSTFKLLAFITVVVDNQGRLPYQV